MTYWIPDQLRVRAVEALKRLRPSIYATREELAVCALVEVLRPTHAVLRGTSDDTRRALGSHEGEWHELPGNDPRCARIRHRAPIVCEPSTRLEIDADGRVAQVFEARFNPRRYDEF